MSPVERLQAAIKKLEETQALTAHWPAIGTGSEPLMTLHRTIDAQLELLRAGWNTIAGTEEMPEGRDPRVWYGRYAAAGLALADAILGSDQ